MSSILKALRRLEEDRARKSQVAPTIAASLLRSGSHRRKSVVWVWPVIFALVTLALATFLWLWLPAVMMKPIDSAATPAVSLPISLPAGQGGEVIIEQVIDRRRPVLPAPVANLAVPAPETLSTKVNPARQRVEPKVTNPSVENKSTVAFSLERQNPIVSAIAWQDDSSARMAVVDGLPVMTGESVATAKVVEILPDAILFEEDGIRFIVRMQPP